ncbi:MAG: VIT and VWA domain-containing protein [Halioglobus sp.]
MKSAWTNPKNAIAAVIATGIATTGIAPVAHAAGLMTPAQGSLPELKIKEHHVDVVIQDGYAITTVDQTFFNPNQQALEAIYSFPVPEKASVGEFTYWIDGKPVTGEVLEKQQARDTYEQEKAQGRETALTEKDDYRTFDSSVYPVQPQDSVRIRLVYLQPVHTDLGVGRYVYPLEEGGVDEDKMAFWSMNSAVDEAFSFDLTMRSSYPIEDFRLPGHTQATIASQTNRLWDVSMANAQGAQAINEEGAPQSAVPQPTTFKLDKDIVVYWRHEQGLPGTIDMVTHKSPGSDRGTFMMTVTPGDDLPTIEAGRDWVFVLDYSGSMKGKYQSLVEGVRKALGNLNASDRFRIVLFNNQAREITGGYVPVNDKTIANYMTRLEAIPPSGGTNLYSGLEIGYDGLDSDRPSAILLVTDGVANVGVTEKKDFLKLLEKHDVRLFSFVMGNSANRPLLEGMSSISNGFYMNISNGDDIVGRVIQTADKLSHDALRNINLNVSGVKVKDLTPARMGSLYRGQQLIVFGHYWGDGKGEVEITGNIGGNKAQYSSALSFPASSELNPEIERLWAFATIEDLQNQMDYLGHDADTEQAIVDLATQYGLVTDYTSMLVVREEVFKQLGIDRSNQARVGIEKAARDKREQSEARDHRQDAQQPAFSQPRAYPKRSGNGVGSMGPVALLLMLPLLWARKRKPS